MRAHLVLVALAAATLLSRCTCFVPVEDLTDDADVPEDAGFDAGLQDDGGPSCVDAGQCPGPYPPCYVPGSCGCGTFKMCLSGNCRMASIDCVDAGAADAGGSRCVAAADCKGTVASVRWCNRSAYSCIANRCVWDCRGVPRTCSVREDGGCLDCAADAGGGCPLRFGCMGGTGNARVEEATCTIPSTSLVAVDMPTCEGQLRFADGGLWGSYVTLQGYVDLLGRFPYGVCTGEYLPTGVLRIAWSCPNCQFVVAYY